ncbi:MAG: tRNA 2-selenouridine(34) synthase MnmH [SAR86 cluster bacterium]|uniref:tRNA 2-selenouridine synthase n=1 Tax=SAR86 cluster bacterium TaxID=2030880 RepID=A0A2A4X9M2_9GAMM|nr:MAG: tRNA 2-selenouridine(34) synthase MnmH [SAR86 cluster bacterium]
MPLLLRESAFKDLFTQDLPMIDVRAPLEFERGAFPNAVNLPLLFDAERHEVGKKFKNSGKDAAIKLGNELVDGESKQERLSNWQKFLQENPSAAVYCFRGGLRSQTVQQWLADLDIDTPLVEGGYKALRRYLINTIEATRQSSQFMIIGGKTGSAKTHLLNALDFSIDLEGLANHRGSAFGRRIQGQPSQIDFENQLAIALLKLPFENAQQLFLEDESRSIGSVSIPKEFHDKMAASPIAMLEESLEARVETIYKDYIYSNFQDFQNDDANAAQANFSEFLLGSLQRIQRRLGGEKFAELHATMKRALTHNDPAESEALHRQWIERLLCDYYDPMYEYQMNKKLERVIYRGSREEFLAWASHINKHA